MHDALTLPRTPSLARWGKIVMPKEHGSWSLAFEPLVFGLLVAPSAAGAFLFVAAAAGFFARRPLRIALVDASPARFVAARRALVVLGAAAAAALTGAIWLAGTDWLVWLLPPLAAGAVFTAFDLRNAGREEAAELAGATAFALLPGAFAALGGATFSAAAAVAVAMLARSLPTVLCVRAAIRAAKTGDRRTAPALISAALALAAAFGFARAGLAPAAIVVFTAVFALRTVVLLVHPRPPVRARTIGMIEGALGAAFVLITAFTWTA